MTTSSDSRSPSPPSPEGTTSWSELMARLPEKPMEQFGVWFDDQIAQLEKRQAQFITRGSLSRSLRGRRSSHPSS